MPLKIIRDDITKIKADAIVNTANPDPVFECGTDRAIYEAAGKENLLKERKRIGKIKEGEAVITPGFRLHAKYIIHTAGPVYIDGDHSEKEKLKQCYYNSLHIAWENKCKSIAFPLISTGVYGYPKMEAFQTAVSVISQFVAEHEMKVFLVVFDQESFDVSEKLFQGIDSYIDEHYVKEKLYDEYEEIAKCYCLKEEKLSLDDKIQRNLEDVIDQISETFQEKLLRMIDERKLSDVDVYKKANMSRKLFSKIRCNKDYQPKKKTALSLALALELNLDEAKDLLSRAGYAFSPSDKTDLIIQYFIEEKVYDIYTIDLALFEHGEPTLSE